MIEKTAEKLAGNMWGNMSGNRTEKIADKGQEQNESGKRTFRMKKDPGIDGILVTVGLCIIALLLCVVMKDSLAGFIETIVEAMTDKANTILNGVGTVPGA